MKGNVQRRDIPLNTNLLSPAEQVSVKQGPYRLVQRQPCYSSSWYTELMFYCLSPKCTTDWAQNAPNCMLKINNSHAISKMTARCASP